jgi:hypothetical protein
MWCVLQMPIATCSYTDAHARAGDLEVKMLAHVLSKPIAVWQRGGVTGMRNWTHRHGYRGQALLLLYNGVNHYEALIPCL